MRWLLLSLVLLTGSLTLAQDIMPANPGTLPRSNNWSMPGIYLRNQVFNADSFPMRTVGQLVASPGIELCTGTLVGPRHVLTAAHCVYDREKQVWKKDIKFFPGRVSEAGLSHGVVDWEKIYIPSLYMAKAISGFEKHAYDYAIVFLKENVGEKLGWMGLARADQQVFPLSISMAGYPGDKNLGTLWSVSCPANSYSHQLLVRCDIYGGMSGSGMKINSPKGPAIVGVFAWGQDFKEDVTKGDNGGVAIGQELFSQLQLWIEDKVIHSDTSILRNDDSKVMVYIKNGCPKARLLNVASVHRNLDWQWVTSFNWLQLETGATKLAFTTADKYFYYMAETATKPAIEWSAEDLFSYVQGKRLGLKKIEIGERPGAYVFTLTCNN